MDRGEKRILVSIGGVLMNLLQRGGIVSLSVFYFASNVPITEAGGLSCGRQFSDNMVLQCDMQVPVWGKAEPKANVTVSFAPRPGSGQAGQKKSGKAGEDGKFMICLDPLKASFEPAQILIQDSESSITITNVLVGEVWLASGQSNMEWPLGKTPDYATMFPDIDKSLIRVITVKKELSAKPKSDLEGQWVQLNSPAGPASSAVGSYFAMNLLKELKVPVGIISSSWGGSRIESWISREQFDLIKGGQEGMTMSLTEAEMNELAKRPWAIKTPSIMYNAMIRPIEGFAMRGVIWYQGESNVGEPLYEEKMKALIDSWRKAWKIGDPATGAGQAFPFYFVQLSPFRRYTGEKLGRMWEAQLNTMRKVPNTGMAVIADCKQIKNIHPKNKPDVGKRLALWALANTYGRKIVYSGPLYRGFKIQGDKMVIEFDHAESGLACSEAEITDVYIRGEGDEAFVKAAPAIDGSTLVVKHPEGKKPIAVRMGWNEGAMPNLGNKEGLPASPFRTDKD